MSQATWFREAVEVYYQMVEAADAQQDGLRAIYQSLIRKASDTGKIPVETLHDAVFNRIRAYRHARLEGFSASDAFEIAGKRLK